MAIPAAILLIRWAEQPAHRVSASIYGGALLLAFGTSAAYHLLARRGRIRGVMQRADHAAIYVLIAGTYAPICLVALPWEWGVPLLSVVAVGALSGIALKLAAFGASGAWLNLLYPVLGWAAVVAAPALVRELSATQLLLLLLGGVVYTAGFPVLVLHRPNPWPRTFGYHEIWHTCTVIAGLLHFMLVASLVT
jgi:hemolysin III